MKLLKRNLTVFEYIPWTDGETDVDPDTGLHTGEYRKIQAEPVEYEGNISQPGQMTNQTFYGLDIRYTHTLILDDPEAEIDEHGEILWNGDAYEIRAVRRSLNFLSAALRKKTKDNSLTDGPEGATGATGATGTTGETGDETEPEEPTGVTGATGGTDGEEP